MRKLIVGDGVRTPEGVIGNAVLVDGARIVACGDAADLRAAPVPEERYPGATIIAGLRDAHLHPVSYTALLSGINLKDARDLDELTVRLRSAPGSGPVLALRFDDETLAEQRLPTRIDLDEAVPDRPVLIHRYCGHIAVANTAALALAGVDVTTPDPEGGVVDRDTGGVPTGVLRETAIELVSTKLRAETPVTPDKVAGALRGLAGLGITSVGAMLGCGDGPWASLGDETTLLAEAARSLPIRVHAYVITGDPGHLDKVAARLTGRGAHLRWAGVKRFSDGSLGGHTAAMCEPFTDRPDTSGTDRLTSADAAIVRHTLERGGTACVHAIGDCAVGGVLDLFAALIADGHDPTRMRIEHASVMTERDIARLGELGIIACIQPAFLGSEVGWLEKRVGPERMARTYPFASLLRSGARLAGGSDCPIEPPHPLAGMALARDRTGLVPDEALTPEEALALFTTGAAAALGEPLPLAQGSPADLVVLDRDPVAATADELRTTEVVDTYVGGDAVAVDRTIPAWV